jgi:glycine C-acetyltransferase
MKGLTTRCKKLVSDLKIAGTWKHEHVLENAQGPVVMINGKEVINMSSSNYLGLCNDDRVKRAAMNALEEFGLGMASGRIIVGTNSLHKKLERKLANFHGYDDAILYTSCFDANAGIFEALLEKDDYVVSDELNHASIIDGIRLSKAKKDRYRHADSTDLAQKLSAQNHPDHVSLVVTDGIFSMDGDMAPLTSIIALKQQYSNLTILVDECHSAGVLGIHGKGAASHCGVEVDIINGTLGTIISSNKSYLIFLSHTH